MTGFIERMRVKICGMTNREDAEAAVAAGADALGFILYEKSRRFIAMEEAIRIVETLPPFVQTVAVTVNATREFTNLGWRKQLKHFGVAQLHGQESPVHVRAVAKYLPVIKVFPALPGNVPASEGFRIPEQMIETINQLKDVQTHLKKELGHEPSDDEVAEEIERPVAQVRSILRLAQISEKGSGVITVPEELRSFVELILAKQAELRPHPSEYESLVSAFMLDTPTAEHGGTGRVFDWTLAAEFKKRTAKPLILSGGLNPENVAKAMETVHPYAVDVSSGVEVSPGRKDHAKMRDFIQICKSF